MSVEKNTISFVKEVVARLKGDDTKAIAEKNYRKAVAAAKGQINALEGSLVDLEERVTESKERLEAAKYPIELIPDREEYIKNILRASNIVADAEEELEEAKEKITFLKGLLKEFG